MRASENNWSSSLISTVHRSACGSFCALVLVFSSLCIDMASAAADSSRPPLFAGLGPYHGAPATRQSLAQLYFEQGVVFTWGFNAAEAARAFAASTDIDPRCALCWWGLAWSLGPNVNADMAPASAPR